jgi:tetratricopeptide (TPR) repeat protein
MPWRSDHEHWSWYDAAEDTALTNGAKHASVDGARVNGSSQGLEELSAAPSELALGEHGAGVESESGDLESAPGLEPLIRSIAAQLVALGELAGVASRVGGARVGPLRLEFEALHRPQGPVHASWGSESATADGTARFGESGEVARPAEAWARGVAAARAGDYDTALAEFEADAETAAADGAHARAAIAYRSASVHADGVGRHDEANRLLRLAGKFYLSAAEDCGAPLRGVQQAYETAAKCFLQAGNLRLAGQCIDRALAVCEALG